MSDSNETEADKKQQIPELTEAEQALASAMEEFDVTAEAFAQDCDALAMTAGYCVNRGGNITRAARRVRNRAMALAARVREWSEDKAPSDEGQQEELPDANE